MLIYNILLSLSAAITQHAYPLVVRLYRLFEYICTFKLLHEDFIHSVWNNIYIFVAVIVLFAIAIKLISAMVNPDLLTDSKKGAKNYYFRAVAAVILIFLVPIVFEKSFEIQEELLTKNMLSSHVFGYKVEEGTNLGQILAWEGFSAFCLPEESSKDKVDSNYLLIRADMDNIAVVMSKIRMNAGARLAAGTFVSPLGFLIGDKTWEYHMFLCPLVGLLLVYEMVLLCMDTLFRAAKLAFLQIMTPIVLGAFVFDPSILKKWAKEFFSTYISLFLKVLAMYFIAITISQIQAEIAKTDFYNGDWLLSGLFKILLIIALLQLAKKIPDLINKIFGLEIKLRGGIKGRLGEMAGIGGIAQKAWTSLGAGAKNLGKTVGRMGAAGVALASNAGWKKFQTSALGQKAGVNIPNTKFGRAMRATGTFLHDSWKGKGIGEIAKNTKEAYGKISNPTDAVSIRKNFEDRMVKNNTGLNAATGKHNSKDQNGNYKNRHQNITEMNNTMNMAKQEIIGKDIDEQFTDSVNSGAANKAMNEIWTLRDSMSSGINDIISSARYYGETQANIDRLDSIKTDFEKGSKNLAGAKISDTDIAFLRTIKGTSQAAVDKIATANNRQYSGLEDFIQNSDFSKQKDALASMMGTTSSQIDADLTKIIKKAEIGGDTGLQAVLAASVQQKDKDLEISLDETNNQTLKSNVMLMKENAIGASYDAIKSDIYAPNNTVQTPTQSIIQQTPVQNITNYNTNNSNISNNNVNNTSNSSVNNNNTNNNNNNNNNSSNANQSSSTEQTRSNVQGKMKVEVDGLDKMSKEIQSAIRNSSIDSINAQKETQKTIEQQSRNTKESIDKTNESIDRMNQNNNPNDGNE